MISTKGIVHFTLTLFYSVKNEKFDNSEDLYCLEVSIQKLMNIKKQMFTVHFLNQIYHLFIFVLSSSLIIDLIFLFVTAVFLIMY